MKKKIVIVLLFITLIFIYMFKTGIPQIKKYINANRNIEVTKQKEVTADSMEEITLKRGIYKFTQGYYDFDIHSFELSKDIPQEFYNNSEQSNEADELSQSWDNFGILKLSLTFNYDDEKNYMLDEKAASEIYINSFEINNSSVRSYLNCEPRLVMPYENSGSSLFKFNFLDGETKEFTLVFPIKDELLLDTDDMVLTTNVLGTLVGQSSVSYSDSSSNDYESIVYLSDILVDNR